MFDGSLKWAGLALPESDSFKQVAILCRVSPPSYIAHEWGGSLNGIERDSRAMACHLQSTTHPEKLTKIITS